MAHFVDIDQSAGGAIERAADHTVEFHFIDRGPVFFVQALGPFPFAFFEFGELGEAKGAIPHRNLLGDFESAESKQSGHGNGHEQFGNEMHRFPPTITSADVSKMSEGPSGSIIKIDVSGFRRDYCANCG